MAGMGTNQMALKRAMDTINNPGLYGAAAVAMARNNLSSLRSMADYETAKDAQEPWAMQERDHSLGTQLKALGKGAAVLGGGLGLAQGVMGLAGNAGAAAGASGAGGAAGGSTGAGASTGGAGAASGGAGAGAGAVAAGGAMDAGIGLEAVRNSFLGLPAAGGAGAGGFTAAQLADSGVTAPWTDLSRQAGFADTLRNVGLGQALQTGLTSTASSALTNGLRQPGSSNADAASRFLKDNLGIDISSGTLGLLGTLGGTALGAYGASQQSNAADANTQLQRDIYNNELSALQPSRNYYNDILQNPDTYYNSPQAKGAVNASLRGLSSQVGNPINNPSALAQSAAYNLGGYNNALNAAAGRAGLGNSASIAGLGSQYGNSILGQGQANGQLPNALGYGLSSLLNTRPNYYAA